jgi:thioredoxin 1
MNKLNVAVILMAVVATLLSPTASAAANASKGGLPKLVDLGADKCIPCKKMAPILEELKKEYAGRMDVEFIDVWKNEKAAADHKIKLIPTQIFYGADGKELFRHEGFFGKADILAKWKELGVNLGTKPSVVPARAATNNAAAAK